MMKQYEKNQLIGHDTYIKYNSDGSVLLLADVSDAGTYMLIDSRRFKRDISAQDYSGIIESGKADVIFVIDSTGSMSGPINNVRDCGIFGLSCRAGSRCPRRYRGIQGYL